MIPFDFSPALSLRALSDSLQRYLREAGVEADRFEAHQLMFHCLGLDRMKFMMEQNTPCERLAAADQLQLLSQLACRRAQGEPLQYLLGSWEFFGRPFAVGPGVLIPRPDTETLIEAALEQADSLPEPLTCIDLCSGSGCIAATLALELSSCHPRTLAVEWSEQALPYLCRNVESLHAPVEVLRGDVLDPAFLADLPACSLLASNPPYLRREELEGLSPEVQREPSMALDGGEDGLIFYRAILDAVPTLLRPGGLLLFEVGYEQKEQVLALMEQAGLTQLSARADLGGIPRVMAGRMPG